MTMLINNYGKKMKYYTSVLLKSRVIKNDYQLSLLLSIVISCHIFTSEYIEVDTDAVPKLTKKTYDK